MSKIDAMLTGLPPEIEVDEMVIASLEDGVTPGEILYAHACGINVGHYLVLRGRSVGEKAITHESIVACNRLGLPIVCSAYFPQSELEQVNKFYNEYKRLYGEEDAYGHWSDASLFDKSNFVAYARLRRSLSEESIVALQKDQQESMWQFMRDYLSCVELGITVEDIDRVARAGVNLWWLRQSVNYDVEVDFLLKVNAEGGNLCDFTEGLGNGVSGEDLLEAWQAGMNMAYYSMAVSRGVPREHVYETCPRSNETGEMSEWVRSVTRKSF